METEKKTALKTSYGDEQYILWQAMYEGPYHYLQTHQAFLSWSSFYTSCMLGDDWDLVGDLLFARSLARGSDRLDSRQINFILGNCHRVLLVHMYLVMQYPSSTTVLAKIYGELHQNLVGGGG